MAFVDCIIQQGLRPTEVTAVVEDVDGRKVFLRVERDFIDESAGKTRLPVGIIHVDQAKGIVLIELPHEADSGISRLWVSPARMHAMQRHGAPA
jgi:hypothetical protein